MNIQLNLSSVWRRPCAEGCRGGSRAWPDLTPNPREFPDGRREGAQWGNKAPTHQDRGQVQPWEVPSASKVAIATSLPTSTRYPEDSPSSCCLSFSTHAPQHLLINHWTTYQAFSPLEDTCILIVCTFVYSHICMLFLSLMSTNTFLTILLKGWRCFHLHPTIFYIYLSIYTFH